jgi:hypothetical protein
LARIRFTDAERRRPDWQTLTGTDQQSLVADEAQPPGVVGIQEIPDTWREDIPDTVIERVGRMHLLGYVTNAWDGLCADGWDVVQSSRGDTRGWSSRAADTTLVSSFVNDQPAVLVTQDGSIIVVVLLTIRDGLIEHMHAVGDPIGLANASA